MWTRSKVGRGVHWEYSRVKSSLNQSQKNWIGFSWLSLRIPSSCYRKIEFIFEAACIPDGSDGRESAWRAGDSGIIPVSGRCPGEGNGYPLQCSCLENSVHRKFLMRGDWAVYNLWGHKELVRHNWAINTFTFLSENVIQETKIDCTFQWKLPKFQMLQELTEIQCIWKVCIFQKTCFLEKSVQNIHN